MGRHPLDGNAHTIGWTLASIALPPRATFQNLPASSTTCDPNLLPSHKISLLELARIAPRLWVRFLESAPALSLVDQPNPLPMSKLTDREPVLSLKMDYLRLCGFIGLDGTIPPR